MRLSMLAVGFLVCAMAQQTGFPTGAPTAGPKSLADQAKDKAEETVKGMAPAEVAGVVVAALCSIAGMVFAYWKYKADKKKTKLESDNAELEKTRIEAAKEKDDIEAQGYVIENERKKIEKDKADMDRQGVMLDNKRKRLELDRYNKTQQQEQAQRASTDKTAEIMAAAALKMKTNAAAAKARRDAAESKLPVIPPAPLERQASSAMNSEHKMLDTTGDGKADSLASDTTGDGKVDRIIAMDQVEKSLSKVGDHQRVVSGITEQLMLVTVPQGAVAGQVIKVALPNGTMMATQVPQGLVAGQHFKMRVPAGSSAGALKSSGISAQATVGPEHRFFHVTVPANVKGGMNIDVIVPAQVTGHAGKKMTVQVPAGLTAGRMFKVPVDALGK